MTWRSNDEQANARRRVWELARVFGRLGVLSFGGPAAHIALMEDELVGRRQWLTRSEFLDLIGAANVIPGPNSTEVAIHIGRVRAGLPGLVVAGVAFIAPAAVIVAALAWAYVRYGHFPALVALLGGVKPVVIAVVVQALWRLGRSALHSPWLVVLALASLGASVAGAHELSVLAGAAVIGAMLGMRGSGPDGPGTREMRAAATDGAPPNDSRDHPPDRHSLTTALVAPTSLGSAILAAGTPSALAVFLVFARIGSVLFGSGYVLLAFLRSELVARHGWLTEAQLLDAVAIGQVTPGPLFTTATFAGWLMAGPLGAAAATVGIFLPAFVFVALSAPFIPRIRRSPTASAILDAVNAASLALMAHVSWELARAALVDVVAITIAVASALLLFTRRINSAWLVIGGGAIAMIIQLARAT